ncbi:ribokinase [Shimia thalassica]|uniref:ribokinase n=1 Tax=Shimia thalassica TaxID=1715693 RepID=UPI0027331FD8|nr:ribokinase [Shimia thalassica]MDP2520462.1 ribokinase [Shimia thalassica]
MTIYNLGSINADYFYAVPHLPAAGETLAATSLGKGLGGKGANMSVAAARAGAHVRHIGAVGPDGGWMVDRLMEYGVDTRAIARLDTPTGHAIINVDAAGENAIVLYPGTNRCITDQQIGLVLSEAAAGGTLMFQNETNGQRYAAETAKSLGMRVICCPAPYETSALEEVISFADLVILNEVEARQHRDTTGRPIGEGTNLKVITTLGAKGCVLMDNMTGQVQEFGAPQVTPLDTTGAGDTFAGYIAAGLDRGHSLEQSISLAVRAAALMVTRHGTADVIPDLKDVQEARF